MVALNAVSLAFGSQTALSGIDLHIGAGECVAIIGSSGAGKSSLLGLLATRLRPDAGMVEILGERPWRLSPRHRQRLRSRIGLVHQAPPLPPRQRVVTAVGAGRLGQWSLLHGLVNLVYPLHSGEIRRSLDRLDLGERLFDRCDQLSGGQLQRVSVARLLYQSPALMLADEPVSAMDPVLASHTLAVLVDEARRRAVPLIVSLHSVDLALRHFDRIIGLRDGSVAFDAPATSVTPDQLAALYANDQLIVKRPDAMATAPTLPLCRT